VPAQQFAANDWGDPATGAPDVGISALSLNPASDFLQSTILPANGLIGPYCLLQRIGSGGMGEVWLAEQTEPVHRRVALKLIKAGMDTSEVVARFQSERQALALMDHPSIAKVFEAGSTLQGRPYFVMEYITGIPITQYCDQHKMTVRERLELFVQVCDAVHHAHQKAIIHRDLKPSNILVSEVDGKPVPRVIDFGVAKAIAHGLIAETQFTQTGAILGTPAYISPEQASSIGVDVDTRTDVYSLGVVFYELLVGARPFDLHNLALDELLRRLREEECPRPSAKLRALSDQSGLIAENRGSDPPTLLRQLRGDVDAIALKALEKDRSRRYGSAADLAADVVRYLRNEAVLAVPASLTYRAGKFARRYRGALTAIAACVLMLVLASGVSIWQSIRATKQRDRADAEAAEAQAVNDFLQNDLLAQASAATQSSPRAKPDPDLKVRTALDRAAVRIAARFDRQPEVEAAIRNTIGQTYMDLGLYREAQKQLERALGLQRRTLGAENPETLKTISRLGWAAFFQGKYPEAETLLSQTLQISRHVLGPQHLSTLLSMNNLANVYWAQGKYLQAEVLHKQTLEIRRRVLGPEHRDTLGSMSNLAMVYAVQGKYAQAEPLFGQTLQDRRRLLGPEHPDTLSSMNNLANAYQDQGKYAEAEALYGQTVEIKRRVLGPEHPNTLISMNNLAELYESQGKYVQAESLFSRILEIRRRLLGPEHPDLLRSVNGLAIVNAAEGKYAQAESLFSHSLEVRRRVLGPEHPSTLDTLSDAALMYQREGKYASAEAYSSEVLAARQHALGSESALAMDTVADLVTAYLSQGKFVQSEPLARGAVTFDRKTRPANWQRFRAESLLGASMAGMKRYAEAEPLLLEGYYGMFAQKDRIAAPYWYHLNRAHESLVQFYRAWGKPAKAAAWSKK
jgi:non-specific serine/threonine protein kinase/serine/threonine-protein kinase